MTTRTRFTGHVAKVLDDKGHCFVVRDGHDPKNQTHHIFAHRLALQRAGLRLRVGDKVSFEIEPSRTGGERPEAQWIKLAA
jgi:cold shock CspA family protein